MENRDVVHHLVGATVFDVKYEKSYFTSNTDHGSSEHARNIQVAHTLWFAAEFIWGLLA